MTTYKQGRRNPFTQSEMKEFRIRLRKAGYREDSKELKMPSERTIQLWAFKLIDHNAKGEYIFLDNLWQQLALLFLERKKHPGVKGYRMPLRRFRTFVVAPKKPPAYKFRQQHVVI